VDPIAANGVLTNIDKAKAFLASFDGPPEALTEVRDKASAWVEFFRHCQTGLEAQNTAAELKIRLERKLGELLPESQGRGRPSKNAHGAHLPDGIDRRQASKYRKIASVPAADFEDYLLTTKHEGLELTTAGVLRLHAALNRKPRDGEEVTREVGADRADAAPELSPADAILADMTRLTRKITLWINSPDGSKLKDYLQACRLGGWLQARTIKVRLEDGTYRDLPTRFRGFNALRWFIRLAGKKGVKAPEKVRELFQEAQGTDAGEWDGYLPTGGGE
jgi:hypothetical protein